MHGNNKRKVSGDELLNFLKSTGDGDEILRQTSLPLSQFAEAAQHFFNDDCTERKRYLSIVFRSHRGLHSSNKSRSTPVLNVNQFAKFLCSDGLPSDGLMFNSVEGGISSRACAWAGIADSSQNRKRLLAYFKKYKEEIAVAVKDIQPSTPDDRALDLSGQNEITIPDHYPVLPSFEDGEVVVTTESGEDLTGEDMKSVICDGTRTSLELWLPSAVIDVCGYDRVRKSTLPALILPSAHSTAVLNAGVQEASQITEEILSDKRCVILPYNLGGYHWCVIFADFCEKTFSFIDPYGARVLVVRRFFKRFLNLLKTRNKYTSDVIAAVNAEDWTIKYLDHAKQTDNYNCGVLVLNFIENFLSGKSLTEVTEPHDYRKVLVADILRIHESTKLTETSEDLPTEIVGTVDGPIIDDSSGSEVNISPHRPSVRRLSSSSESSWNSTPFYKKPSLDTSDDSAEDALLDCEKLSLGSSKNCYSFSKKSSSSSSDTDELAEDAPTDARKPSSKSSEADGSLVIEGVRATSSSSTVSVDDSAPMKPSFLATGDTAETQDYNIDKSNDSDFSDNESSESNEREVFPRKLKIQKRKSRKEARSTSSLRREPFQTTITQFHVPVDVWQSSCQGGKIDRPNLGYTIKERISGAVAPCPVNLSDSGRFNRSRTVVTGYAYCEHRDCRQFKFTITNLASNPILTVFARGTLDHAGGPRTTQLRGVKRQRVKAVLKITKTSKYMEGCIEEADEALVEAGNLQDIRPLPTIDKARSEVLAEEDLHADDTMDVMCELRKQECLARRCTQYIQKIADPLLVYLYSQEQLQYVQRGVFDLFFDATGSVVRKPRKNLKRVMYYAGVINIDGEMLPILELISCDHDAATITSFLLQFKHFVLSSEKPWPLFRRVVTDFSLALINSFMLAWNGCSLEYYLVVMYKAIYGQTELADLKKMTFVRLCRNHFMKNSASDVNKHMGYPATKVAKEGIALLVAARDLQTFESIFNSIMTVMLSRTRSPEMMRHYESLEKLADGFAQCLPMRPGDTETSEEHAVPTVPAADEDFRPGLFKGSPFWTHFRAKYETVVSACVEHDDHQYPLNDFYQPDFVKNILVDKLAPLAPLWSDAMTLNDIPDATASNAPVEKWFDIVKNVVLREDTNLKVGRFIRRLSTKIAVSMKTLRLGLTEYLRPKGRVRRQTQKTTTEEVENQGLLEEEQWAKRRRVATHFQGNYLRSRVFSNPPPGSSGPEAMEIISASHEESITENVLDVKGQGFDFGQHKDDELMFIYGESSHPVKWGDFYSLFGENYLSSKIIDALLSYFAETWPASSLAVLRCDTTLLALDHTFDAAFPLNNVRLLDKTQVAMPYCVKEHWMLGLFNFVEKEYTVLDPGSNEPVRTNNRLLTRFRSFLMRRNRFSSEHVDVHGWTIVNFDHALQEDEFNCGILVFHYISCLQKNIPVSTVCDPSQVRSQLIETCSKAYEAYREMNVSTVQDGRPKILPNGLFEDISFYTQTGVKRDTVVGIYNGGKVIVSRDTLLNLCGTSEIASRTIDSVVHALGWKEIAENADKYIVFSCDESYKCLFGTLGPRSFICSVDLRNKTGLMPYCIDGHWRLLVFDVTSRTIINLNPARGLHSTETKRRKLQFVDFLRQYNELCKQYKVKISGWTTTKPNDYPRQKDRKSCGVYVILYIMCGVLSIPFSDIQFKHFDPDTYRKELGVELLRKSDQMRHRCLICGKGEDAREKNSKSLVRSKMVACDSCNRWVHTKSCARNITCSEEELDDPTTNYYCEFCTAFSDSK